MKRTSGLLGHRRRIAVAAALAATIGLAGCGGDGGESDVGAAGPESPSPAETTAAPDPAAAPTAPTDEPTEEPTAPESWPTAAPEHEIDAGTVTDGASASASGSGDATVSFEREGDFAAVVHLDCTACTGDAVLTGPGRMAPWGEDLAGLEVSYLLDVMEDSDSEQVVWLAAEGEWSMRMESWNDLEHVSGEQSGTGAAVLFLIDEASAVHVSYEPADKDDQFSGRYFGVEEGESLMFGDTEAMDEELDLALPGVLAVNTRGSWTLTPVS